MSYSPCQSLFHEVRCTPRCQGVILHVWRCGCKASWITNPPSHAAHPHPLHPHHTVLRSLGRQLCWWGLAWIAQCCESKRHSHRQLQQSVDDCGLQHPTQMVCYFKLCFGIWASYPTWDHHVCNSHTATAGVPCPHLPFWCALSRRLNFKVSAAQRWQSGNCARIQLEHLSGPKVAAMWEVGDVSALWELELHM